MGIKEIRMARLFNPADGRSVCIPVDHGAGGSPMGLTDPVAVLGRLCELGVDSTLIMKGLAKITQHLFERKDAPGRILTMDTLLCSTTPGASDYPMDHEMVATVEEAVRGDFCCAKILLVFGTDKEILTKNMKHVADLATECDRWNIPMMVEPVMWGPGIPQEKKLDPMYIEHAARVALELGCDILKMPYNGNQASFTDLIRRFKEPVMILGGPKMSSIRDVFEVAYQTTAAGARGLVFGRNVWQNPNMDAVIRGLQAIVHSGATVDDVMRMPAFLSVSVK
jgi:fructose-bisphosphate aldolase, class I